MLVGYARVSTHEQKLDLQLDALLEAGVQSKNIFIDKTSGATIKREQLDKALELVREGDVFVVWRLDRMSRSLKDLIDTVKMLRAKGVQFKSLRENIDTSHPGGKLIFHIFGALAEFERDLIRERTLAGLEAARARGRVGGRPQKLNKKTKEEVRAMYRSGKYPIKTILKKFNISKTTLYRLTKE